MHKMPSRWNPTAALSPEIAARTVTLMAPSKTYNVPGLGTSFAIISDPTLRAQFVRATTGIVAEVTALGFTACEAAYRDSEPWRQALLAYLRVIAKEPEVVRRVLEGEAGDVAAE